MEHPSGALFLFPHVLLAVVPYIVATTAASASDSVLVTDYHLRALFVLRARWRAARLPAPRPPPFIRRFDFVLLTHAAQRTKQAPVALLCLHRIWPLLFDTSFDN